MPIGTLVGGQIARIARHVRRHGVAYLALFVSLGGVAYAAGTGRFTSNDPRYTLLVRNTRVGDGGAAATTCNSSGAGSEPCLDLVNKGSGYAAAFRTRGHTGFRLQTSGSGTATPFLLDPNATGLVAHLNADRVDGFNAKQLMADGRQVVTASSASDPADSKSILASCPSGKAPVGGGGNLTGSTGGVAISESYPSGSGWRVSAFDTTPTSTAAWQLIVYAVCISV